MLNICDVFNTNKKTLVIAEIGLGHDGSLGMAHSYIEAISKTGADAVKFQTHIPEYESTEEEKFRVNFKVKFKI
jgi:N-acetylneuraminate synthase